MKRYFLPKIAGFILLGLLFFALVTGVTMYLWNTLLPPLFNLSAITFWQAAGLLILSRLLFGGFGRGGGGNRWKNHPKNQYLREKWENMTPQEREQFKQQWRQRCNS